MYLEKLIPIMKELYKISGFKITLFNTEYKVLAAYPEHDLEFCKRLNPTLRPASAVLCRTPARSKKSMRPDEAFSTTATLV